MTNARLLALAVVTLLVGASDIAFAGAPPPHVPEPSTLAVLAVGVGAAALVKFRRRK